MEANRIELSSEKMQLFSMLCSTKNNVIRNIVTVSEIYLSGCGKKTEKNFGKVKYYTADKQTTKVFKDFVRKQKN